MSDINQIALSSLLNSISGSNLNNRTSLNTKSDIFDSILENTLVNLNSMNQTCTCNNNNSLNSLDMLNTILSSINNIKIDIQKLSNENTISNMPKSSVENTIANMLKPSVENTIGNISKPSGKMENAINSLEEQVGKPYVWGANGPEAFDCSGLVRYIYKTELGKEIPRTSYDQSKFGQAVDKKDLQAGDLIFFDTMKKGKVSHVGMYVGNNEFIHASNAKSGVKKSKLSGYYEEAYRGARRP